MEEYVQVKADVPRALKRRAFAALALREEKFNQWLRTQLEAWLREVESPDETMGMPEYEDAIANRTE
jgi:hypothetical protein